VLNYGVWGEDRPLTLQRKRSAVGHRVVAGTGADDVRGITLERCLAQLGWESPDLIKIDIEGGEEAVIPGAGPILERTPVLIIEIHDDRIDSAPVMSVLSSVYRFRWQLNDRLSRKPLFVMSHAPLPLDEVAHAAVA
jgi:hypothetical protein